MKRYSDPIRRINYAYIKDISNIPQIEAISLGPINISQVPFIPSLNSYQLLQGMKKRVIHAQKPGFRKYPLSGKFARFVRDHIQRIEPLPHIEMSSQYLESWLTHYDRPEGRKNQIRNAYQLAIDRGVLSSKNFRCKCFGKREFYTDYKYARIINPRDDCLVALLGPYMHDIEQTLFYNSHLSKYFTKGLNHQQMVDKLFELGEGHECFVETDYSSFEGSYSPQYQKVVEYAFFKHMLQNNPEIMKIVDKCYSKPYKFKGKWREPFNNFSYNPFFGINYAGSRMSGDLWTSSMNGFSNLMNMLWVCELSGVVAEGVVEGDDGLFALSSPSLRVDEFDKMGFTIKLDYQVNIYDCAFCKKIINPRTRTLHGSPEFINKFGWCHAKKYFYSSRKIKRELLKSKALSLGHTFNGCPMLGPMAYSVASALSSSKYRITDWYTEHIVKIPLPPYKEPSMDDRLFYEYRFGVSVETQLSFERRIWTHPLEPFDFDFGFKSYQEGLTEIYHPAG